MVTVAARQLLPFFFKKKEMRNEFTPLLFIPKTILMEAKRKVGTMFPPIKLLHRFIKEKGRTVRENCNKLCFGENWWC